MAEEIFGRKTLEKLGRRLRDAEIPDQKDLDSLQAYRSSYKDVISEVFHIVDENAKSVCKSAICAFRIKRIDSIIGKLRRLRGELELKSMYDIAGCRCIVEKDAEIYKIIAKLQQSNLQIVKIKGEIRIQSLDHNKSLVDISKRKRCVCTNRTIWQRSDKKRFANNATRNKRT